MRAAPSIVATAAILSLGFVGSPGGRDGGTGKEVDAGTTAARSEGEWAEPRQSPPSLELVARVGCADCAGPELLTPTVMTLFGDGTLAVLDRYEPFVRIFDAGGKPVRSFGAAGQGPGELGNDLGGMYFAGVYLLPWPDGGLSVLELMPAVLETFARDGTFAAREELDLPMAAPSAQAFSPATGTYFRHSYVPMSELPDVIERCEIELEGGSTCRQLTTAADLTGIEPEGMRTALAAAATPDDQLVIADTASYRLWITGIDGNVVRQFGRDIPAPPKSEEELQSERDANRARRERGRSAREIDPDRGHIAPSGLQVDGAGRIWVLTMRYTETTSVFDVFDPDGEFLGEVVLEVPTVFNPNRITPFVTAGDHLAVMSDRADGSASIHVYRMITR
jgi:hypothetical protein